MTNTDKIEKQITLRAPRTKVWRALTDASQFGTWFRVKLDQDFKLGQRVTGKITVPGFENIQFAIDIDTIDAEQRFAFRWHPYAIDPNVDYSKEPPTRVEFQLSEVADGTHLTVVESGFDKLPASRRDEAFRMNGNGWAAQLQNIERHVAS